MIKQSLSPYPLQFVINAINIYVFLLKVQKDETEENDMSTPSRFTMPYYNARNETMIF